MRKGIYSMQKGAIMENTTNTVVEATTILETCKHCRQSQLNQVIIQTDSIYQSMFTRHTTYIPTHSERRNQLANYLANIAIDKGNCCYTDFHSMEAAGRRIINSDKLRGPYLRVSPAKG
ncbi:hypothetical protein H5410_043362 [Solanum commersonii]|uniref:Uncharacterized protein n=1 Tax=Solanum commersonii TaxID=4109 RepID=A0A9J5Y016_SOLCO|nr:hypothetical protein H5410_043362 [Solanum commersonii]